MEYSKDLKVQIYDFYTNEILDNKITLDEAVKKYKVVSVTLRKSLKDGHCIRNKSKRLYFGVRYPHEPINERLEKRLNEFYKWNNFYTIYKRTSLKYDHKTNSLNFWLSHDYNEIYIKKSVSKFKRNHKERTDHEWYEDILKIKHMIKQKICVYIFKQVREIKKNFGNSEQFVSAVIYKNPLETRIVKIDPITFIVEEIFELSKYGKEKYGKKIEQCMRPGRIYRNPLNFCEDIGKNYKVGDKIDWIQIDENITCKGGCGRISQIEHSEQTCVWCKDYANNDMKSIIMRKINTLQDVTIDEEDIDKKLESWDKCTCERCGIKLEIKKIGYLLNQLSIDSTTPGEGHQKGKWLITCQFCNYAKNDASEQEIDLLIEMLKTNKIDFTRLNLSIQYRHMYISEIFNSKDKVQSKELIKEKLKTLNFRSDILGFPFIPFIPVISRLNKLRTSCCLFSPSLDRINNSNKTHEHDNVNVVPTWFNVGRRDRSLEEMINYIKTTFPNYNPDTLEVIFPPNIDCKKWVENTMNKQKVIENRRDGVRGFFNTNENVKSLVNIPKDELQINQDFINLKRRINNESATELDKQIFFEELDMELPKTELEKVKDLEEFIIKNHRLPNSKSDDENEKYLGRKLVTWRKDKKKNGGGSGNSTEIINALMKLIGDNWNNPNKLNDIKSAHDIVKFFIDYKKLPSKHAKNNDIEKKLGQVYARIKTTFKGDKNHLKYEEINKLFINNFGENWL
jgi:hypothetical protein